MVLKIPKLPIWEGTYPDPDTGRYAEFNLIFNEELNIFQQSNISTTFYESNDYKYITKPPGSGEHSNKRGNQKIDLLYKYIGTKKLNKILEIGAASDYIIRGLGDKIYYEEATLVDPSLKVNSNKKIKAIKEYFPCSRINSEKYDLIYSINVLEHVENPKDFLLNVKNNLAEDGFIFFIFPDVEHRFNIGDVGCLLHEHINYFTNNSAASFFENCGFEIIDCSSSNDNGEVHIFCKNSPNIETLDRKSHIKSEEVLELSNDIYLMQDKVKNASEYFLNLYSQGMKVGFHGACNALSNFLFLSDLNNLKDFYIFDGDKLKSNTYLPYSNKKILHYTNNLYKEMDVLIIAATNFSKEITKEASKLIDKRKIFDLYKLPLE